MENISASRKNTTSPLKDKTHGVRLQKAMASAGVASRRDCEKMIENGLVRINNQRVTELPLWVDINQDKIEVSGKIINSPSASNRKSGKIKRNTYIMLNKPRKIISTTDDDQGRKSVIDIVDLPGRHRLFPVGRLDADSTGLVLLTDDGELANKITHPRYEMTKEYSVAVRGKITQEDLNKLRKGLFLTKKRAAHNNESFKKNKPGDDKPKALSARANVESVSITGFDKDRTRGDKTHLKMILKEGQNREIRRLLARVGYKVLSLKRVAIGPLKLKGIATGQWRKLNNQEMITLRKAIKKASYHTNT